MIKIDPTQTYTTQQYRVVTDQYNHIGLYDGKNNNVRNATQEEANKLKQTLGKRLGPKNVKLIDSVDGIIIQTIGNENDLIDVKRNHTLE